MKQTASTSFVSEVFSYIVTYIQFPFLASVFYFPVYSKSNLNLSCSANYVHPVNASIYLAVSSVFACLNLKHAVRKHDLPCAICNPIFFRRYRNDVMMMYFSRFGEARPVRAWVWLRQTNLHHAQVTSLSARLNVAGANLSHGRGYCC